MALPKRSEWKAPWQVKDGKDVPKDEQVVDPDKLADHLYNLLSDKEKAQTARDTALALNTELTGKVTELETAVANKGAEGLSDIQKLTASVEALKARAETAELNTTRLQVLNDKNLKPEAAEFLTGKTAAELNASADKLVALGLVKETAAAVETKLDDQGNPIVTQPVVKERHNSGDPRDGDQKDLPSVDDFLKSYDESHQSVF